MHHRNFFLKKIWIDRYSQFKFGDLHSSHLIYTQFRSIIQFFKNQSIHTNSAANQIRQDLQIMIQFPIFIYKQLFYFLILNLKTKSYYKCLKLFETRFLNNKIRYTEYI